MKELQTKFVAIVAISLLATGCMDKSASNQGSYTAELPVELRGDNSVVAVVNGTNLYASEFASHVSTRTGQELGTLNDAVKNKLLDEYIQLELLSRKAEEMGLGSGSELKIKARNIHKNLLAQALLENEEAKNPVTDADIQAKYNDELPKLQQLSYKARHILLETEDEAKAVIQELTNGADFATLAKTKSTGPSGSNGGDLGWFTADRMVAPFSAATAAMEKGTFSKDPVKTRFGYHVILKEDEKQNEAPPLENLRPRLEQQIKQDRVKLFLDTLDSTASIERKIAGTPQESDVQEISDNSGN